MADKITKDILQQAVAKQLGCFSLGDVKILTFEINEGATRKGENFMSVVRAVKVVATSKVIKYGREEKEFHFIAKCLARNEGRVKWMEMVKHLFCLYIFLFS